MKYQHMVAAAVAVAMLTGSASLAFAEATSTTATSTSSGATTTTSTTTTGTTTLPVATPPPPVATTPAPSPLPTVDNREYKLEIGAKGRVMLRGNIESISGNTLMVRTWGGVWTVKILPGAEIMPRATGTTPVSSQFSVGDYVGAQGTVLASPDFTIEAKNVRDWTLQRERRDDRKENRENFHDHMKDAQEKMKDAHKQEQEALKEERKKTGDALKNIPRTHEGTVGTISGSSFMLTKEGKTITVNTSASTKFVDKNWNTMAFVDIKPADSVRVFGVLASSTIAADVVRDVSVPR